jgi:hypothetical protein
VTASAAGGPPRATPTPRRSRPARRGPDLQLLAAAALAALAGALYAVAATGPYTAAVPATVEWPRSGQYAPATAVPAR